MLSKNAPSEDSDQSERAQIDLNLRWVYVSEGMFPYIDLLVKRSTQSPHLNKIDRPRVFDGLLQASFSPGGGGWVRQRCRVSYVTWASN